jgi:hypothetical protein
VAADCIALVGGVLLILAVARGLTDWFVDAQLPAALVELDPGARGIAARVPALPERLPSRRRHADGYLLGRSSSSCR